MAGKWEWADNEIEDDTNMTWLEMLVAFEMETDTQMLDGTAQNVGEDNALKARSGVGKLTSSFRSAALDILKNQFTADVFELFNRNTPWNDRRAKRLTSLGITGQWAVTNTWAPWDPHLEKD